MSSSGGAKQRDSEVRQSLIMRKAKEIQTGEFRQDVNAAKEKIEQCARRISEIPESVERELVEGSHVDGQATIDAAATIKQHCGDAVEDMLLVPKEGLQGRVHGASVGAMERVLAYQYVPKTRTYLLWVEDSDEHGAAILPRRLVLPNERELNMSEKRIGMGGVSRSSPSRSLTASPVNTLYASHISSPPASMYASEYFIQYPDTSPGLHDTSP